MNDLANKMKNFWEKTSPRNAHLGYSGEAPMMLARYKNIIGKIRVSGKTIIDFGCGGGLLGKYVLEQGAFKYIGYDVAERSLQTADMNTSAFVNKEFVLVKRHCFDFSTRQPDILFCLACMIHFPSLKYLNNMLAAFDGSGAEYIILEIRDTGEGTVFHKMPYGEGTMSVILSCKTNELHVSACLQNYSLIDKMGGGPPSYCQVLRYQKRRA